MARLPVNGSQEHANSNDTESCANNPVRQTNGGIFLLYVWFGMMS